MATLSAEDRQAIERLRAIKAAQAAPVALPGEIASPEASVAQPEASSQPSLSAFGQGFPEGNPQVFAPPQGPLNESQQLFGVSTSEPAVSQPVRRATAFLLDNLPSMAAFVGAVGAGGTALPTTGPIGAAALGVRGASLGGAAGEAVKQQILRGKANAKEVVGQGLKQGAAEALGRGAFHTVEGVAHVATKALPYYWAKLWKAAGGRPVAEAAEIVRAMRDVTDDEIAALASKGHAAQSLEDLRNTGAATIADVSHGRLADFLQGFAQNSVFAGEKLNALKQIQRDLIDYRAGKLVDIGAPAKSADEVADALADATKGTEDLLLAPDGATHEMIDRATQRMERPVKTNPAIEEAPMSTESVNVTTGTPKGLVVSSDIKQAAKDPGYLVVDSQIRRRINDLPEHASFGELRQIESDLKGIVRNLKYSVDPKKDLIKEKSQDLITQLKQARYKAVKETDAAMAGKKGYQPLAPILEAADKSYASTKALFRPVYFQKLIRYAAQRGDAGTAAEELLKKIDKPRAILRMKRMLGMTQEGREAIGDWARMTVQGAWEKASSGRQGFDAAKFIEGLGGMVKKLNPAEGEVAKDKIVALIGQNQVNHLIQQARRYAILQEKNPLLGPTMARFHDLGVLLTIAGAGTHALTTGSLPSAAVASGAATYIIGTRQIAKLLLKRDTTDFLFKALTKPAYLPKSPGKFGVNHAATILGTKLLAALKDDPPEQVE